MKIKNIIKRCKMSLCLPLAISVTLSSCNLDRFPLTSLAEDVFWTSEDNVNLAIAGLYRGNITYGVDYNLGDWWAYSGIVLLDGVSDIGYDRRGLTNAMGLLTAGNLTDSNARVQNCWDNSYTRIEQCNRFIENVDQTPVDQDFIDRVKSEARFLRACQYFYLASYFHDVPLVTQLLSLEEANTVTKNTRAEILEFVVSELEEVAEILPRQSELLSTEIGRTNAQAAYSFLGKAKVLQEDWTGAAAAFKAIIDLGDSQIASTYTTLFNDVNENASENIFSTQYVDDIAGHGLPQHAYNAINNGWCLVCPTANLVESYEFIDGTPFSYEDPRWNAEVVGENRDPRLDYTVYYNKQYFCGIEYVCDPCADSNVDIVGVGQSTQTGYLLRKFFNESWAGDITAYGGNMPIVRYADVLLMYLESELMAGTAITQTLLDMTINTVRGRADVNMPAITETDPTALMEIIKRERMIELAFEGHRLWDLYRWGDAVEELNKPIYGASFSYTSDVSKIKQLNGEYDPYYRYYTNTRAFTAADMIWPVPLSEKNVNPNLY